MGTFTSSKSTHDLGFNKTLVRKSDNARASHEFRIGIRQCPNLECQGFVMVISSTSSHYLYVIPPQLISFRINGIPPKLVESMKEAVAVHSVEAYRASSLMVRRTLELLCEEKKATGKNLLERIKNLAQFAVLSPALLSAADHLRILGNDAAHVEAKDYDSIGKEHSEAAIELAKEILKAVYQHDDLVARLKALKR